VRAIVPSDPDRAGQSRRPSDRARGGTVGSESWAAIKATYALGTHEYSWAPTGSHRVEAQYDRLKAAVLAELNPANETV
jgi:hypothetical protein